MSTLFIDVDTQLDFVVSAGALYGPGAERILPAVARLNLWASRHGIPLISTADAHAEDDAEFRVWPHHCVAGTLGQRKPEATLVERRMVVPNRAGEWAVEGARQIIVEKQTVDAFQSLNLARVIERLGAERCVVYGVFTEVCVLHAVRGLLRMGKAVTVVTDAIEALQPEGGARALEEACAGGAALARAADIAV
jgi:nicotinamidase/pyrazinamidase